MTDHTRPSIQASAGTGKTTRVVRLLLERLLSTDTEPSRLLALTFTVRAANEMRDRLGSWLARLMGGQTVKELGGGLDLFDELCRARSRGERALAELDRVEIGTIHSFAAHLLRQYPIEAGISPTFVEDEGGAEASLFRELWSPWLDARLRDPAEIDPVLGFLERCEISDLRSFAAALCKEGVPLELHEEADGDRAWRDRLLAAAARAESLITSHAGETQRRERRVLETLRYMVRLFRSPEVTLELRRQVRLLEEKWPAARHWKREEPTYRDLRHLARAVVDCDNRTMAAVLKWLRPFAETFRREYTRSGFVSFQGLLVRAARILRDYAEIRDQLKRRFRLIVVDEFQDTDPLQGEILLFLAERADRCEPDPRCVEVEPGKLVIVGDEKQSIYLFRGADLEAYQAIASRLTGDRSGRIERLSINYRSRRELVRFVNEIGSRTMRIPDYIPIEPGPLAGEGGKVEMILFPQLDADDARESEAQAIAAWVAEGVGAGKFSAGDVALLLRTLGFAEHYTAAFRRHGIDFAIEGEKHFYGAQEVLDMLNLLGAIVDPSDQLAVVGLLRSPLGAVRDRELAELGAAGALCPFDRDRVPAALSHVGELYDLVVRLHDRSLRLPAVDFVREVIERIPILEIERATFRGDQAVANVQKLLEALTLEGANTLSGALRELRRRFRERDEEGEAAIGDDQLDAVRILSIHKAKGLEFPVVVLADLHREHPAPERRPFLREWLTGRVGYRCGALCSLDWIVADERYRRIEEDEARRLLYVALTRAKDRILLTGGKPDKGLLGLMVSALADAGLCIESAGEQTLRGCGFEVDVRIRDRIEPSWSSPAEPLLGVEPDYESEHKQWQARETESRRLTEVPLLRHPSAPAERLRGHSGTPGGEDADRGWRLEQDDDVMDPLSVGSRCHDVLSTVDLSAPACAEADEPLRAILDSFFRSEAFREIQRAERVHREVPFLIELDDGAWSGQIDVLYSLHGRWIVADYKSDLHEEPERYRTQARVYSRAAQRALKLAEPPEFQLIYLRTGRVARV